MPWQLRPPREAQVVVVKGTYQLLSGQPARLAEEQEPPNGDIPYEDQPESSLRYPSDFAVFKPATDIFLVGHGYPSSADGTTGKVRLELGSEFVRELKLYGDRALNPKAGSAQAVSFEKMPLRWERAPGDPIGARNPVGRGFSGSLWRPNLELLPGTQVQESACFAPIKAEWEPRKGRIGTYDRAWKRKRWPYFPDDFDWGWFNAAPPDMQLPFIRQSLRYSLAGVRPGGEILHGYLPDAWPRVFKQTTPSEGGKFLEIPLNLDTIWFDGDQCQLILVWRGATETVDDDASDLAALYVMTDPLQSRLPMEQVEERCRLEATLEGAVEAEGDEEVANDLAAPADPLLKAALDAGRRRRDQRIAEGALPAIAIAKPRAPHAPTVPRERVLDQLRQGRSLAGQDLSDCDLADLDLRGRDLSGTILVGANLENTLFDEANLTEASLVNVRANGTSWVGAHLARAALDGASLRGARFTRADVSEATFGGAHLEDTDFSEARGVAADFSDATLVGAVFSRAQLQDAEFVNSDLTRANFASAVLTDARFYDARGEQLAFTGANLENARADGANFPQAQFRDACAKGSVWEQAKLAGAVFMQAQLQGANFANAELQGANFCQAEAGEACFRKARLAQAKLIRANLMQATFEGADLSNADLRGANLYQAEVWKARLSGAQLDTAFVAGSKLQE